MEFKEAVNRRRSVRKYDPDKALDSEKVKECLELAVLAPNSSNMQLWEFYHITSKEILTKMSPFCFNQNAAKTAQQMVVIVVRKDLWKKRVKTHVSYLKNVFGNIPKEQQSKRAKFAFTYYTKIIPLAYADFLGILGYIKYGFYWMIGLFRPIYRQARKSDMRIVAHKSAGLAAQTFMLAMADINYDTCPMEGTDTLRIKKLLNIPSSAEINMVISCGIRVPEGVYGERFRIPFEQVYKEV
ncbi:MAG: nitroreductase family protein [Flavobacteriaceae bacterium]|nr:MAG: nitroreductase family protein [Flavobacteriaceae bacterium]